MGEMLAAQKADGGLSKGAAGAGVNQHTPAEVRSSVTTAPKLVRRPARARPGQVPAAGWRWVAFGQVAYRLPTSPE
jgi:hypothetical protein